MYSNLSGHAVTNGSDTGSSLYVYPSYLSSAAGLNSNLDDLARFAIALSEGSLLKADELKKMMAPARFANGSMADVSKDFGIQGTLAPAIGWFYAARPNGKHPCNFMEGGSSTAYMYFPEDDLTVVVLTNLQGSEPVSLAEQIAASYLSDLMRVL